MSSSSPLPELPAIGFLSEVSSEHREFLASFGKFLRPEKGEIVITEGSHQESLSLILTGVLHAISNANGGNLLLATLGAGDSLGEINLFDPATACATVVARSNSLIWTITRDELTALFEADTAAGLAVTKGLLRELSGRIRQMNAKLAASKEIENINEYWSRQAH